MTAGTKLLFALTLAAAAVTGALGFWQLGRLADRKARNRVALSQRDLPVVDLRVGQLPEPVSYRRVRAAGRYDYDREIVIRGRLLRGTPGIQIVTPLRPPGRDTAILVNRGFVPSPDAGALPTAAGYREEPEVELVGVALPVPDEGDGQPLATPLGETWRRLDLTALRARLPYPVAGYYLVAGLRAEDGADHTIRGRVVPVRIDPPALDDGPHLSYAVQWFLIGGAALGFGLVFLRRRPAEPPVP